jgi:hypothetical protein
MSIALPILARARVRAGATVDLSQMRQIHLAHELYAEQADDRHLYDHKKLVESQLVGLTIVSSRNDGTTVGFGNLFRAKFSPRSLPMTSYKDSYFSVDDYVPPSHRANVFGESFAWLVSPSTESYSSVGSGSAMAVVFCGAVTRLKTDGSISNKHIGSNCRDSELVVQGNDYFSE